MYCVCGQVFGSVWRFKYGSIAWFSEDWASCGFTSGGYYVLISTSKGGTMAGESLIQNIRRIVVGLESSNSSFF